MKVIKKILAGQPGTKKLINKFGERLLYVRYYEDWQRRKKYKTCEIIIDEKCWDGKPKFIKPDTIVKVKINYGEIDLGVKVKRIGGRWNKKDRLWEVAYKNVIKLGLEKRIIWKNKKK